MRWLFSRLLVVQVLLALATSLSLIVGRDQPAPSSVAILHLNACQMPCWNGIVPRQTTLNEARTRLYEAYGPETGLRIDRQLEDTYSISNQSQGHLMTVSFIAASGGDTSVRQITIYLAVPYAPTLAEIYPYLPPIGIVSMGGNWVVHFPTWSVRGVGRTVGCYGGRRIQPGDFVVVLTLGEIYDVSFRAFDYQWQGFRTCYG